MKTRSFARLGTAGLALSLWVLALPAAAGTWGQAHALQGPFGVASPPEPPLVVANANGHAMTVWNATGAVRFAEKAKGSSWARSQAVPGGNAGAGPVAIALGNNEVAAIAYVTAATKYVPAKLKLTLRGPSGSFGPEVEPAPGAQAWDVKLGVACDGTITLVWGDQATVWASHLAGSGHTVGQCDGVPGTGAWSPAVKLSTGTSGAGLVDLATNDDGIALAAWQQGTPGNPVAIAAAMRSADGVWQAAQTLSAGSGLPTWNPKPGLDAAGNAAVGFLDGNTMVVARKPAALAWGAPELVSGTQSVYYPSLAMSANGEVLATWLAYDASVVGAVWSRMASGAGAWTVAQRLSRPSEDANWPSSAFAPDGSMALVGWTDNAANTARAAVWALGTWRRKAIAPGWWGSVVPVAAGGGVGVAGWARPAVGNPNSATLYGRTWD